MTTRAAVYLRISRDDLATGLAVERQRADCMAIIAARGWECVGEFVDNAVSASKRTVRRPSYDRMVAAYEAGSFEALVCYDLDRLTRQPRQLEDWIDSAEERGLVLVTANGEADLSTDSGRMFARIKATVARSEIERKSARQRRANVQRIERGLPAPGRRRYGYESDGVTIRESEAVIVRRMFAHVADGGSLRSFARALIADGVSPAPGRSWSSRRVRDTLNNPAYSGEVSRFGEPLPGTGEAIVSAEVASEVRAILADAARTTTPGPAPRYLASGLSHCGICGALIYNIAHNYRCKDESSHPNIKRHRLDARIRAEVARAILVAGPRLADERKVAGIAPLIAAHEKNERAARATSEDRDEGLLSPRAARTRLIELRDERQRIEADLTTRRSERSAASSLGEIARELLEGRESVSMTEWDTAATTIAERFEALDIDRQRDVVRALLTVTVYPGRDPRRVIVWHVVATELNPDEDMRRDAERDAADYA